MAYGTFDITPVDVAKPIMLGEQVRQNRLAEELKNYQIAKAQREDESLKAAAQFFPAALQGDKAAQAKLLELAPDRGMAVLKYLSEQANSEYTRRLLAARASRAEQLAGRGAGGGGGSGFIAPPPPAAGGGPAPGAAPRTARPTGIPTPALPSIGGGTTGPRADVVPQVPPRVMMADASGFTAPSIGQPTPALPQDTTGADIGDGDDTVQPAGQPTGGSGDDDVPPGAPFVDERGKIRIKPLETAAPARSPTWVGEARTLGYAPVRDAKGKAVIEDGMMEMWTPDRQERVFIPMKEPKPEKPAKTPEDWIPHPTLPDTLIERNSGKIKQVKTVKPLPGGERAKLSTLGANATEFDALFNTFRNEPDVKDEKGNVTTPGVRYGGYKYEAFGDLANLWRRNIGGDPTEEAAWWQRYQEAKNIVRHELFGSALTATEKREFDKAMINPGMKPDEIAKNLKRQREIALLAVSKIAHSWKADGFNQEAIEAAIGVPMSSLPPPTSGAPGSTLGTGQKAPTGQPRATPSIPMDEIEAEIRRRQGGK